MYKVFRVQGGWHVFLINAEGIPLRTIDGHPQPYTTRQNAYRRCKKLNTLIKQMDEEIRKNGAIIV